LAPWLTRPLPASGGDRQACNGQTIGVEEPAATRPHEAGKSKEAPIQGKVVVITGATSGIGRIAATRIAALGGRIVLVARDRRRADQMLATLREAGPDTTHTAHIADLSTLSEMKRVGREIAAAEPRIDVLINNAGNVFPTRELTPDGLERTFAINHMAYFVLTHELRERLVASAPARIISTASRAHRPHTLDFDDLQLVRGYGIMRAYGRSKLANIMFTRELARRLAGTGVTANCLHPGLVKTGLGQRPGGTFGAIVRLFFMFAGPPEPGAETIVYLATSPDVASVTGGYFVPVGRRVEPSRAARDDAAAQRLWEESEKIAGIKW
jgi:NAD(P)-dependent dehydrogenase (short-subunit alcohol dehydrogenase family)